MEPKGNHLLEADGWKETFLKEIAQEAEVQIVAKNKEYCLVGLPFYNETITKTEFEKNFRETLH